MKTTIRLVLLLLLIALIITSSCKKDPEKTTPNPEPEFCYDKSYLDKLPKPSNPFYLEVFTEDEDFNIVYVWSESEYATSGFHLTKIDTSLNEIWSKLYCEIEGYVTNLIHDKQNNLYLTTYIPLCKKESDGYYFENIYVQSGMSADTCAPFYNLESLNVKTYSDNSESRIYKFNSSGDLLWTTEIPWSSKNGKNIDITGSGEIFIATYTLLCDNYEYVYKDGVFQDTIIRADSTFLNIYKLSAEGSIVWGRNIQIPTFFQYEWYSGLYRHLSINVSISENAIYIAAFNAVYTYSFDGELINKYELSQNQCSHFINRSSDISGESILTLCEYYEPGYFPILVYYAARYTPPNNFEWIEEVFSAIPSRITNLPDGGFLIHYNYIVSNYSHEGSLIWRKEYFGYNMQNLQATCNNGFLLLEDNSNDYPNYIVIIRSDENGEF